MPTTLYILRYMNGSMLGTRTIGSWKRRYHFLAFLTSSNVRTKMHVSGSDAWEATGQTAAIDFISKLDSPGQLGIM